MADQQEEIHEAIVGLRDSIANLGQFLHGEGAMLTTWHLTCEWMDADGDYWMTSHTEDRTPPWRVRGMLESILAGDVTIDVSDIEDLDDDD